MKKGIIAGLILIVLSIGALYAFADKTKEEKKNTETIINYSKYVGTYQDSISKRAILNVIETKDGISMEISWPNSAYESIVWKMNAKEENNQLVYTNCEKSNIDYSKDENGFTTVEYQSGKGYFIYQGGNLVWDGAEDTEVKSTVFEKIG